MEFTKKQIAEFERLHKEADVDIDEKMLRDAAQSLVSLIEIILSANGP